MAANVLYDSYNMNKNILIVGNNDVNKGFTTELTKKRNIYGISSKWTGGSLTNWNPKHFKYTQVDFKEPSLVILLNLTFST